MKKEYEEKQRLKREKRKAKSKEKDIDKDQEKDKDSKKTEEEEDKDDEKAKDDKVEHGASATPWQGLTMYRLKSSPSPKTRPRSIWGPAFSVFQSAYLNPSTEPYSAIPGTSIRCVSTGYAMPRCQRGTAKG